MCLNNEEIRFNSRALAADPKNPVALKNLGAILGQEGDSLRALYYLRQSSSFSQAKMGFHDENKVVIIVKGGLGASKSIIAINLTFICS